MKTGKTFERNAAFISFLFLAARLSAQTNTIRQADTATWTVPPTVRDFQRIKQQQFIAFNPRYLEERSNLVTRLRPAAKQLFAKEAVGQNVQCGHDIFEEIWGLIVCSADVKHMNERLKDLEVSMASPATKSAATAAQAECMTEWWKRLDWTYEHLKSGDPIPPDILDRFNSPEKLTALLTSLSVSDMARTGRDNGWEFNLDCADLIRWIVRDRPDDKAFHPKLKETMLNLILQLQDPETGFWGQRYVIDGRTQFVPDLSTTFHIVSYLEGRVPHLDRIADTALAVRELDAPLGWFYKGQVWNHNFLDVIELFKWCWPHASERQRAAMAAGIEVMLHRCLAESLQPDGSFKFLEPDTSIEQSTYWGAEFLARAGFFDKSKRFWTDRDFPEAEDIRLKITSFIKRQSGSAAEGSWYSGALNAMNGETKDASRKKN